MKEPHSGSPILLRNSLRRILARGCGTLLTLIALNASTQTYSVLHHFQGDDGKCPWGALVESSNVLYGTTHGLIYAAGADNWGEVFRIKKDGTGFTILRQFNGEDGSRPKGRLVLIGNALYGTSCNAGNSGYGFGNIFKINIDGTGFTVLKQFAGEPDAAYPVAGLLLVGSTLYGTTAGSTSYPGAAASTVFSINTDGSGYTILKRFSGPDGYWPRAPLIRFGSTLFGTTANGGTGGFGTLFRLNTDGSGFAVLHNFISGADGREPDAELLLVGVTLFGTTWGGGTAQQGTVFKINIDGTGYQVLKSLSWVADGAFPETGLVQFGNTLLGVARGGGLPGQGTIFKLGFDGSGFVKLWEFPGQNGSSPYADLLLSGTTLYGTTALSPMEGGSSGVGVVYSFQLVPNSTTPLAQTAEAGTTALIRSPSIKAVPASYQWFLNATNLIAGATGATQSLTNLQTLQSGAYACAVSNEFGSATSSPSILNVITPVPRRSVPALSLIGQLGATLNVDFVDSLSGTVSWSNLNGIVLTDSPQYLFDTNASLPQQRFYRIRNADTNNPAGMTINMAQEITLTGSNNQTLRLDYINRVGPIDNWTTLATVNLTNSPQLYFDTSGTDQRLYRIMPSP